MHSSVFPLTQEATKHFRPSCFALLNDQREIVFLYRDNACDVELVLWNIHYGFQIERKVMSPKLLPAGRPVANIFEDERNRFLMLECIHCNNMRLVTIELSTDSGGLLGVKGARISIQSFELDGWNNKSNNYMQTNGDFLEYTWNMFFFIRTGGPATILLCKQQQMIEIDRSKIGVEFETSEFGRWRAPPIPFEKVAGPNWTIGPYATCYDPSDKLISLTAPNISCYDFKTGLLTEIHVWGPSPTLDGIISFDPPAFHNRALGFCRGEATLFCFDPDEEHVECWKLDLAGKRWIQIGKTAIDGRLSHICVLGAEEALITGRTRLDGEERYLETSLVWTGNGPKELSRMCFEEIVAKSKDRRRLAKHMSSLRTLPRMFIPVQRD